MASSVNADNLPNPGPCPFAGFQCEGAPIGNDGFDPNGRRWYTVVPPHPKFNNKCGLVYVPDAKGIWHNSRVLADQFAYAGYHVVVICNRGVFRAEGEPFREETPTEVQNRPTGAQLTEMMIDAGQWLNDQGCLKIGAVGYCAGGGPILRLCINDDLFSAAFVGHPTGTSEATFAAVTIPVSVAFADNDRLIDRAQRTAAETGLLRSGSPYQISLYSHVHHGFSCRRAFTTQAEVFAKKQSFIQAITWMEEHLHEELERQLAEGDITMTN